MILLVNQSTGPLFLDVINAFATHMSVKVFAGEISAASRPLSSNAKWIKSVRYRRTSTVTRMLSWSMFSLHYFFYLLFCVRPKAILVVTNPPFAPVVTYWLCRLRNIPFHILIYDLYPEALVQASFITGDSRVFRYWSAFNQKMFSRAKTVFTLGKAMEKAIKKHAPLSRIHVIFNWADAQHIKPLPKSENPFITEHNLQGKLVVLYAGNMGLTHDLESVIEAADLLKSTDKIVFIFIGDGGKRKKLVDRAAQLQLTNVKFLPFQDSATFPYAMAAADIGIITLDQGADSISVPSKTYVNLAAGLCIAAIAGVDSELASIVEDFEVGVRVDPGTPRLLADKIQWLSENPDSLMRFKNHARNASAQFTPANAEKYVLVVSEQF